MTPGQEKHLEAKLADWCCDGQTELEVPPPIAEQPEQRTGTQGPPR